MSWNYRIIHHNDQFAVHEVFYRDDGSVNSWTETPVFPRGESVEELRDDLSRYLRAFEEPILIEMDDGTLRERSG